MTEASTDRFAILLDGDLTPTGRLRAQIAGCRVIAADGGMRHAETLELQPELWVGDFDSAPRETIERNADVPSRSHPSEKAVSDGELAIAEARTRGARSLILCGALGGPRSDHMMFHLVLAIRMAAEDGIAIILTSGAEEARPLLPGQPLRPDLPAGTLFSIVSFSPLSGLTIDNAQWPLDAVEVAQGSTLTLSNVARDNMTVTLRSGTAALVAAFEV